MQYKWTANLVTIVGTLMGGLATRILIIGIPTVAAELHAGAAEIVWMSQSFLLANTAFLLLFGRISDMYGRVRLYNLGFIVFTIGTGLSALSANPYQLIGFRVVQGVGSALISANAVAIVTDATPKNELGTMLGINQTSFRFGSMIALTATGLILSLMDWRGLFYLLIPFGIFGIVLGYRELKEVAVKDVARKMDWWGFGLFTTGLTLILIAVTYLSSGPAAQTLGFGLLIIGFLLILAFIKVETSTPYPLLDLKLFKIKLFAMANIALSLNAFSWGVILLIMALFLQIGLGYTSFQAGIAIIPLDIIYLFSSLLFGRLSDKYGSRLLSTSGLATITISLLLTSTFSAATRYPEILITLLILGLGNGMFNSPNIRALMSSVPANRRGVAAGFQSTMFAVGFTTSYGLAIALLTIGIPFNSFSLLLQGLEPQSTLALAQTQFFNGFHIAAVVLAIVSAIAIIPSSMRGSKSEEL